MKLRFVYLLTLLIGFSSSLVSDTFLQTNLVSDISGLANATDPHLLDPWGMSFSATSPIWVSDRAAGVATLYTGAGAINPLVVTVPPGTATAGPTGQVFAGPTTSFTLNGTAASFIFDTLGGTIAAWNGGTTATTVATTAGARYEGLALANNMLFAANFVSGGGIDVFNSSYTKISSPGGFVDPMLPAGFAPFNVQVLNGKLYVEYASVNPNPAIPVPGAGGGVVDVFDTNGNLLQHLITNGGALDAPWGVAFAPSGFGSFGGDLLVGNFGNGEINAFDPTNGTFIGTLSDATGAPLVNSGLWAIAVGNNSANTHGLYFNAGLNGGADGLFGVITAVPEPQAFGLAALGAVGLFAYLRRRSRGYARSK